MDIKERIGRIAGGAYLFAFLTPPTPREQIQRGQFQDASRSLVERRDEFDKSLLRVRHAQDADRQMREWAEKATELYRNLRGDQASRAALDEHWRSAGAELVLDRAVGEVGQAEAAFLLALCRHEQAERAQARLDHANPSEAGKLKPAATDAWAAAVREWSGYREQYAAAHSASPAQAEHIRALADRAKKLAQK